MYTHFKNKVFFAVFLISLLMLLTSCMKIVPEITASDYSVIFEYEDEESLPSARLSLFALSESDVRRYDSVIVDSLDSDFFWETKEISIFSDGESQWVGSSNLVLPQGLFIPDGLYQLTFFNADGQEVSVNVDINYNNDYYSLTALQAEEKAKEDGGTKKIALYNYDKILVYFGQETSRLNSENKIKEAYKDVKYMQNVWNIPSCTAA